MAVHFTPEYFDSLGWREGRKEIFLNYFTQDQRDLERQLMLLTDTHQKILLLFDECLDRAFSSNLGWENTLKKLLTVGSQLGSKFKKPFDKEEG